MQAQPSEGKRSRNSAGDPSAKAAESAWVSADTMPAAATQVREVIRQQLKLMDAQLELLRGAGAGAPAPAQLAVATAGEAVAQPSEASPSLARTMASRAPAAENARPSARAIPLTPAERQVWLHAQTSPAAALAYNEVLALRIRGGLRLEALRTALRELIARHEALRSTVDRSGDVRHVAATVSVELAIDDASDAYARAPDKTMTALLEREADEPFDLATGPLLRARVARLAVDDHLLVFCLHHLVADGHSMPVLVQDLLELYAAAAENRSPRLSAPPPPAAGPDNAAAARMDETDAAALAWWRTHFAEPAPPLELPGAAAVDGRAALPGGRERLVLDRAVAAALRLVASRANCTLLMSLLAGCFTLIHRLSGAEDLVVGVPILGRSLNGDERRVGHFVDLLPVRARLGGDPEFGTLLQRLRETLLAAYEHYTVPLGRWGQAAEKDGGLPPPRVDVVFNLDVSPSSRTGGTPRDWAGLEVSSVHTEPRYAKFNLCYNAVEVDGELHLECDFDGARFDRAGVRGMLAAFGSILTAAATDPSIRLSSLPLVDGVARELVLEGSNATERSHASGLTLHGLFERQADAAPDAPALVFGDEVWSYARLESEANRVAHWLHERGIGAEDRVGVCIPRSFELVAALLGVLKAGAAYVPLDASYPTERLSYMLEDSGVPLVLAVAAARSALPAHAPILELDGLRATASSVPTTRLDIAVPCDSLAYVIYTSGSTGRPKGAMNEHRGVVNRLLWMQEAYDLGAADTVLQKTPFSFDVSVWEFFWPLLAGSRLAIARPDGHRNPEYLARVVAESGVTTLHFVPAMLREFLEEPGVSVCTSVRRVVCSGEALPRELADRFFERMPWAELHNLYGPTECAVDVSFHRCAPGDSGPVPIGRPVANTRLYVLDRCEQPLPRGVAGELFLAGVQVGRGYLGRPGLTAERFLPDPFSRRPGARMYRSGDLARYRADGELDFLGRVDHQVKIRGFRIELGEIEAVLLAHPGVAAAAVVAREAVDGDPELVAYLVPGQSAATVQRMLRLERAGRRPPDGWHRLPNGMPVAALNRAETDFTAREVFVELTYLRHGVSLADGACVFDVGAHVGLFTVFVGHAVADATVYAFEPAPAACDLLRLNAELHGVDARIFEYGLAARSGRAEFTMYPQLSILSGLHGDAAEEREVVRAYLTAQDGAESMSDRDLDDILTRRLTSEVIEVELRTLSDVIREHAVKRIDLLKLDVEKAELEILEGLTGEDWPKVRQVVAEVHDHGGRLRRLTALLERQGFRVVADQDPALRGTVLHNVYAVRAEAAAPEQSVHGEIIGWHSDDALVDDVRRAAALRLPEYMVPAAFVVLESFPLSPSGKLNRGALPEPRRGTASHVAPPSSQVEAVLAEIWTAMLGVERVASDDDFFRLGGHSLRATRVVARIREVFGVGLEPRALFEAPTLGGFARRIEEALRDGADAALPPLEPTGRDQPVPLSFAQHRLWLLQQLEPDSPAYNIACAYRLDGELDATVLRDALSRLVQRHEALRTVFRVDHDEPVQVIVPAEPVELPVEEISAQEEGERRAQVRRRADEEAARPFDLESGPLFRARLLRLSGEEHILLLCMHHAVSDGWSHGVMLRDLSALYAGCCRREEAQLPPLPVQYPDYAVWQRERMQGHTLEAQLAFWRSELRGAPTTLDLPPDHPRPESGTLAAGTHSFQLPGDLAALIRSLARAEGCTVFMTLLAGFALLLHRWTGQEDVLVGTNAANRPAAALDHVVGLFANTLVIRAELGGDPSFRTLMQRVRERCLGAYLHQEVPFDRVVDAIGAQRDGRHPLFQAMFLLQNAPDGALSLDGVAVRAWEPPPAAAKFELLLVMAESAPGFSGTFEYAADVFEPATVARLTAHFEHLLRSAVSDPDSPITALALAAPAQTAALAEAFNADLRA